MCWRAQELVPSQGEEVDSRSQPSQVRSEKPSQTGPRPSNSAGACSEPSYKCLASVPAHLDRILLALLFSVGSSTSAPVSGRGARALMLGIAAK